MFFGDIFHFLISVYFSDDGLDRNGLKISKMRRALDLESDGNFMMVVAIADRLRPGLTEYLMKKG